jgi:FtsH-binding integral membrane protein
MVHLMRKVGDMMEQQKKQWKEKATDYKTYAGVLLALSVFFYIGMLIPSDQSMIAIEKKPFLLGLIVILLVGAFSFYQKAVKYIRLLRELDQ